LRSRRDTKGGRSAARRTSTPTRARGPSKWGTAGGYRGSISVDADGDGSMLTLSLHTTHIEHADHDIAATLDAIRRLVEADV
jgi:hypothetical protein